MTHLETLTKHGLRASIQPGGRLRLEPDWLITDEIRALVRGYRDEIVAQITAVSTATDASREVIPDYRILMVATNLDSWEASDPRFGREVMLDVCYRQLDAAYYAWLRHRMENARKAHDAGAMDDSAFSALRERFNMLHAWALRHIGEGALRTGVRTTNVKSYVGPSEQTFMAYRKTWDAAWEQYQRRAAGNPSEQCRQLSLTPAG